MLLKKLLHSFLSGSSEKTRRRNRRIKPVESQVLERRALLAGNVRVELVGGNAVLTGDNSDNSVEIVAGANSVLVRGLSSTTINGASTEFTLSTASATFGGAIQTQLAGGNDRFVLGTGVTVAGAVKILGGDGSDSLAVTGSVLSSSLSIDGGGGSNSISVQGSTVGSETSISSAGQLLVTISSSTLNAGLSISGSAGDDDIVIDGTTIGGGVKIHSNQGNDDIALKNSTLNSGLHVNAGRGNDVAFVDSTRIAEKAWFWMLQGNDSVQIQGTSQLEGGVFVGALLGRDALEVAGTASVGKIRKLGRPANGVSDSLITSRITDTTTGALGRASSFATQFNPALSVQIAADSIVENAGTSATQVTVSRAGSTATALTVSLTSSNTNRARVPATVTIPAGQSSVTASVEAVDNTTADADVVVTVTATAAGFNTGTDTITVTGQETAALTVTPPTSPIAENAAEAARTFTVARNTSDLSQPLTVNLTSGNTRLTVPASVVIPANAASVTFVATTENDLVDGNLQIQLSAAATGFTTGQTTVTVNDNDTARLSLSPASTSVSESSTTGVQVTVTRNTTDNSQAVTVALSSSTTRLTVPATVSIPAGSASATFTATTVPNTTADGNVSAVISATSSGFTNGTTTITVNDDDTPSLSITPASPTFSEGADAAARTLTITRNNVPLSDPLTVNLSLGSITRMTLPGSVASSTVQIPANQASATVVITAIDNNTVDGSANTQLTVSATGFSNVQTQLTVTDNDSATLTVTPTTTSVSEGSATGVQLTVARNTSDVSTALTVTLSPGQSGSTRLRTPATVVIPVGAPSVQFAATPVTNDIIDGNLAVTVSATATGFASGSSTVTVNDDDTVTLSVTPQSSTVSESVGTVGGTVSLGKVTAADQTVFLTYQSPSVLTGPASVVIPAGQSSVSTTFTVVSNSVADNSVGARIAAGLPNSNSPVFATVTVTDADAFSISTNTAGNTTVASNNTLITKNAQFTITGTTQAGAEITLDADGDGQFDDGSTTADPSGNYTISTTLTNNTTNRGANRLLLKATDGSQVADTAVNVHFAVGSVMRFETNSGTFDVELLDSAAPNTVANFKAYETSSAYDNLIVHRSDPGFVIQAGGFKMTNGAVTSVTTNPAINSEFLSANSNVRGTLSMALSSAGPNSGTSQWFINMGNNSALDANQHTVFGRVIGDGMSVVDSINNIPKRDVSALYDISALNELPLRNAPPAGTALTGKVAQTVGSAVITGTGTLFQTQLQVGSSVEFGGQLYFVTSIASNTQMTVNKNAPGSAADLDARKDVVPANADFVVFSNIHEILGSL